jgi:hypothetical protein
MLGKNLDRHIGCSFILKVGVKELIVNTSRISCLNLTSFFVCIFTLQTDECGAFTIDSSRPTLRINLNEHPILYVLLPLPRIFRCIVVSYELIESYFLINIKCSDGKNVNFLTTQYGLLLINLYTRNIKRKQFSCWLG